MSATTKARLTPSERLRRGLAYSAVGPLDITRGTVGLSLQGAQSAAGGIRRGVDKRRHAQTQKARRRRLPWILAATVLGLAAGGVAFSIVRRSMQPEPSPRPPSVDFDPKP